MSRGGTIRVAVADDDAMVRSALRNFLSHEPDMAWAGEAADGPEALQLVQSTRIDVLLLDLAMPRMSGLQALPQVRQAAPHTQVLMFSSFPNENHREQARRLGAAGYLVKGCDPHEIAEAIRAAAAGISHFP